MLKIRKSNERGYANHGWLRSYHSFSFANYYDPNHMGFRSLRVINEDCIVGGSGFGAHPHNNMEIVSYIKKGQLQHEDSMGNKVFINAGEIQVMSAGTGVVHAEFNGSQNEDAYFFQIWINPLSKNQPPRYEQKSFIEEIKNNKKVLIISKEGKESSLKIDQNANVYLCNFKNEDEELFKIDQGHGVWIQLIEGEISVNGHKLLSGDALSAENLNQLVIKSYKDSEFLVFDLE